MSALKPNTLELLRARLTPGAVLLCVENTYLPVRAGTTRTVTELKTRCARVTWRDGKPGEMALPMRAMDVTWIDPDTVRWPLDPTGKTRCLAGHTVTFRLPGATS